MNKTHLRRRHFDVAACGASGPMGYPPRVQVELTDNPVEVSCGSCMRTLAWYTATVTIIPKAHPARAER